jgi:hypothetical protein
MKDYTKRDDATCTARDPVNPNVADDNHYYHHTIYYPDYRDDDFTDVYRLCECDDNRS